MKTHTASLVLTLGLSAVALAPGNLGADPALPVLNLSADRYYVRIGKSTEYLRDPGGRLRLADVQDRTFTRSTSTYPSFGMTTDVVWLRFRLRVPRRDGRKLLLEVGNPLLHHVELTVVYDGRTVSRLKSAAQMDPAHRPVEHHHHVFPLHVQSVPVGEVVEVYVRAGTLEALSFPVFLWAEREFYRKSTPRDFAFGLFFGLIFVMAAYNLFLFISIRDRSYIYYVLYIFFFGLFFFSLYGYTARFFFSFAHPYLPRMAPMFSLLTSASALAFARNFLVLRTAMPRMANVFNALIILHLFGIVGVAIAPSNYPALLGNLLPITAVIVFIPTAFQRLRDGYRPALYFVVAWSFVIAGVSTYIAENLGLVSANFFTHNSQLAGAAMEALLLSFALGYRVTAARKAEAGARQALVQEQERALAQERRMAESFARFVPREFLNYLERDSVLDIVHGDSVGREMTVLFTDIRDFTSISEELGSAETFRLLNTYLEQAAPIINEHSGFVDKFIGDAVMALFQEPASAVRAAIAMSAASRGQKIGQAGMLRTGFGLHHGELMLGTVGSPGRLETTVIGDTVNLAARIESVTKKYGTSIVVSDTVYKAIEGDDSILAREIDVVQVKGKVRPVVLFEVFNGDEPAEREAKAGARDTFLSALILFRSGDFDAARDAFEQYRAQCPFDPLAALYLERLVALDARPEARQNWTGVYDTWSG